MNEERSIVLTVMEVKLLSGLFICQHSHSISAKTINGGYIPGVGLGVLNLLDYGLVQTNDNLEAMPAGYTDDKAQWLNLTITPRGVAHIRQLIETPLPGAETIWVDTRTGERIPEFDTEPR